jgi:hypothetical protein
MKHQFLSFALICLMFNSCHKKSDKPNILQTSENISQDASADFLYKYTQGSFNFISSSNAINQTWPTALDSGSMYSYVKYPYNLSMLLLVSNKKTNPIIIGNPDIILDLEQLGLNSNFQINKPYQLPSSQANCVIKCSGGFNYDATSATCVFTTISSNKIEGYVDGKFEVYNANTGVTTSNIQGKLTFNLLK